MTQASFHEPASTNYYLAAAGMEKTLCLGCCWTRQAKQHIRFIEESIALVNNLEHFQSNCENHHFILRYIF